MIFDLVKTMTSLDERNKNFKMKKGVKTNKTNHQINFLILTLNIEGRCFPVTTKELQEAVLSNRKNLPKRSAYFYLFFDENKQISFPIIFNGNKYNFCTKFRGMCFSSDCGWGAFYCVDKKGKEIYSTYFKISDKDFFKGIIDCFATKGAELVVSLKQGRIFSNTCCFAIFGDSLDMTRLLTLDDFLENTK